MTNFSPPLKDLFVDFSESFSAEGLLVCCARLLFFVFQFFAFFSRSAFDSVHETLPATLNLPPEPPTQVRL